MAKRDIPEINAGSMADIAFLLLIFFLVTTTMDKDKAYIRNIPKKVEIDNIIKPPDVEKRNICAIRANNRDQLMVRGEIMKDPDEISVRVVEFYQKNERSNDVTNNFPMYSRINLSTVENNIRAAELALEEVEKIPGVQQEMIDYKANQLAEWEGKKSALKLYGKSVLPEIHFQAHVRIEVQKSTSYELFAKIQSEIEEAIYELRNEAANTLFNESYNAIIKRYDSNESDRSKTAQVREDKGKLDLLKILYPDRFIEVTPK